MKPRQPQNRMVQNPAEVKKRLTWKMRASLTKSLSFQRGVFLVNTYCWRIHAKTLYQ
jgi:hypothetical protein